MDVYCGRCGEPWDIDSLHMVADDAAVPFGVVRARFAEVGCSAMSGPMFGPVRCSSVVDPERAGAAALLFGLLGDDVDGVAGMLEDLGI